MDELINEHFGDRYFSAEDGLAESCHVFVQGNRMEERIRLSGLLRVAETGFGTGLNLLASVLSVQAGTLVWYSVERYPLGLELMDQALAGFGALDGLRQEFIAACPGEKAIEGQWNDFGFAWRGVAVRVRLWRGDVLEMLRALASLPAEAHPDCWVLDGHSPAVNPGMWSPAVFAGMARCSRLDPPTTFATYTAAGSVKSGLRLAGFAVKRQAGHGSKRHMISGAYAGLAGERNDGGLTSRR